MISRPAADPGVAASYASKTIAAACGSAQMLNSDDRGSVPETAAAHQRHPGDPVGEVGGLPERETDVGQRTGRDQPQAFLGTARVDDELDAVGAVERGDRHRQVGAVEARLAVDERGVTGLGDDRMPCTAVDGSVGADEVAHDERIVCGPVDVDVAADGHDAHEVGDVGGGHDRDGVVVSRVAVDDHPRSCGHAAELGSRSCTLSAWNR